ncbi:hypothetical protein ElyMa_002453000 [Elysia marginata]|uniref:Uncharacterized protein n=1 Tax=Elysia marginata TaxID=1093978 RepID=A0AAV4GKY2_9GAST|nr:hypothetical protein ElyMa_002453000 [Elysia marginata]
MDGNLLSRETMAICTQLVSLQRLLWLCNPVLDLQEVVWDATVFHSTRITKPTKALLGENNKQAWANTLVFVTPFCQVMPRRRRRFDATW